MLLRTQNATFQGAVGAVDGVLDLPGGTPSGWALVLHPHPLHGGARDNKIVTTVARACVQHGLMVVRPDFRGVGASAGAFDRAEGETTDMRMLVEQFIKAHPQAAEGPWVLAGFSFGTAVAAQLYAELADRGMSLPSRLILIGCAVERFRFRPVAVPDDTLLVHGEHDEVVPLAEAMDFARARQLPVTVVPDAGHFFHGKLLILRRIVESSLDGLAEGRP
ncbi:alpha/beta hydrolase [Castellaniella sp. GW247-6E4]|uniref:alpha/beta hydrolase n=1 Tax=Castellaniella sp. GW247-6E4 TaxID=3140380 RepID=UPI00331540E1